jgi:PAS domain S-box-containing protein
MGLFGVALLALYGYKSMSDSSYFLGGIDLFMAVFLAGALVYLRKTMEIMRAAIISISLVLVFFSILVLLGGQDGTGIFWIFIFPPVAFFIVDQRFGLIYSIILFFVVIIAFYAHIDGVTEYPKAMKFRFLGSYFGVTIMSWAFEFFRGKIFTQLEQSNEEILNQKEEITLQAEYLTQVNLELEKLSIVASETDNAIVICDNQGNIEWFNDGFTKLYGYSFDEFLEKFGRNIKEASNNTDIIHSFDRCFEAGDSVDYQAAVECKEGHHIWVHTTLSPIIDSDGKVDKIIAIDSDITKQKEAEEKIKQQNEEISSQRDLLASTNTTLEKKNHQITQSIDYAKMIQDALLPDKDLLKDFVNDSFVFFRPRDIVSGDFYWIDKVDGKTVVVCSDCTGHGVPGAFMSLIGINLLNEIILKDKITSPAEILTRLNDSVQHVLKQDKDDDINTQDDGMDITLCVIDHENNKVTFGCANHFFFITRNGQMERIDGDPSSIGGGDLIKKDNLFTNHEFEIEDNTVVYMFSDGYFDQFGGENNQKFLSGRFMKLLDGFRLSPMAEQSKILDDTFKSWKGKQMQLDDVLVIGLNLSRKS